MKIWGIPPAGGPVLRPNRPSLLTQKNIIKAERAIASKALVAQNSELCGYSAMDSHMAGPMSMRLPGVVWGHRKSDLGQKNNSFFDLDLSVKSL